MRPRAWQALPAGLVPSRPARALPGLLGSQRGPVRDVQRLVVQGPGGGRLERIGRRLAHLRERSAAQARALVRPGGPGERRLRALAGEPVRPRSPLRPRRDDAQRSALSVRRHDAQDRCPQGRGEEAGERVHPPEARGHLRQRGRGAGRRRPDPRGAPEPPRRAPLHLPSRRRVRHRLQLRVEEHARPQLPLRGEAARRRDLDAPGGPLLRAEGGRRLRRPLRRARRRRRGAEAATRATRRCGRSGS